MQRETRRDRRARSMLARASTALACLATLAGCPGPEAVRPVAEGAALQRAERLAKSGDHRASAQGYEEAASVDPGTISTVTVDMSES